jgi:hypothetical protein
MKKYFPILLSKKGELVCLQHLSQSVKDNISPIIEVLSKSIIKYDKDTEAFSYDDSFEKYLKTHWDFDNAQFILDFSLFEDITSNIKYIKKLLENLIRKGINVIPSIQENSPLVYTDLLIRLVRENNIKVCIRSSNNSGGFINYSDSIGSLIKKLKINSTQVILLLDLGVVEDHNYPMLSTIAAVSIQSLNAKTKWADIVVASGSFPPDLSKLIPPHKVYRLPRHEWKVWNLLSAKIPHIKYSDFGTKYPVYAEVNYTGTISIKYSTENDFVVYRGSKSEDHVDGHGQYITHSEKLILTPDYLGQHYSWGDLKIHEYAQEDINDENRKTGTATTWVQISQNHHISLLEQLL